MSRLVVRAFSISLDGFGAGPDQTLETPMGVGSEGLHTWMVDTDFFDKLFGGPGGKGKADERDEAFAAGSFDNLGAWILGRNMFGPVRGPWPNEDWKGWWGDNPPYHVPVFVLTNYPREPVAMEGGTTFHFVTDGIESALAQAKKAAGDKDVRLGGGVSTLQQYLRAGLVDELHIAVSPVLLGKGENLYAGIDFPALGYELAERVSTKAATHLVIRKAG